MFYFLGDFKKPTRVQYLSKSLLNLSVPHSCPGVAGGSGWLADPDPHEEYRLGFGSRRLIILVHARSNASLMQINDPEPHYKVCRSTSHVYWIQYTIYKNTIYSRSQGMKIIIFTKQVILFWLPDAVALLK